MDTEKRPKYGADRPDLMILNSVGAAFWITLGTILFYFSPLSAALRVAALETGLSIGLLGLFVATAFLTSTRVMEFRQIDSLLDSVDWNGVESILDVGRSPGLLLIGAAKRVPEAKAVGVDTWQSRVESGSRPERALENARIEGVTERVEVKDGDVRNLPFEDSIFDVVLSRAVLRNLKGKEERERAIEEIMRVLKPSGQVGLILVDSWHLGEYLGLLRRRDVRIQRIVRPPRYFPPGLLFLALVLGRSPGEA